MNPAPPVTSSRVTTVPLRAGLADNYATLSERPYRNGPDEPNWQSSGCGRILVRRHQAALLERGAEVGGLRVDDNVLGDAAARQRVASHLLERDLLWPPDVHVAVERSGDRRAGHDGRHLPGRDRLNQRVGNTDLIADDQRIGDLVGELLELGGAHKRVGQTRFGDDLLLSDLGAQIAAAGKPVGAD